MKKGSKELQEKVQMLQKEKDQIMAAYKEKRAIVDELKAELQNKIAQYSKFAEKGEKFLIGYGVDTFVERDKDISIYVKK
jgi:uncharacterized coiled-coil DUF342 family protein